jgi:hypothetical protein
VAPRSSLWLSHIFDSHDHPFSKCAKGRFELFEAGAMRHRQQAIDLRHTRSEKAGAFSTGRGRRLRKDDQECSNGRYSESTASELSQRCPDAERLDSDEPTIRSSDSLTRFSSIRMSIWR